MANGVWRRRGWVGAAVGSILASGAWVAVAGTTPGEGSGPPRAGEVVPLPAAQWAPALTLGRERVEPTFILPIEGIGLPAGTAPEGGRVHRPMPYDGTIQPYDSSAKTATVIEDLSAHGDVRAPSLLQSFEGIPHDEWQPPDCDIGVGFDHIVQVVNDDFYVYDKCGNVLFATDINTFTGDVGFFYDPKVAFDPWNARWIMLWHYKSTSPQVSQTVLVVSADSTPMGLGSSWFYRFDALKDPGTGDASWADYYDLGFGRYAVFASGNQFRFSDGSFRYAMIRTWNKDEIYNAAGALTIDDANLTNADGSATFAPRAAELQWDFGTDGFFVNTRAGGGTKLTVWKLVDPLGAHTLSKVDLTVSAYDPPPAAVQPNGTLLDTIDARLMNAVVTRDLVTNQYRLYTGNQDRYNWGEASDRSVLHLWEVDPLANVVYGDTLVGAPGYYYWFPSGAADYSGHQLFSFSRCGPSAGQYAEARYVDLNEGGGYGFSASLQPGAGNYASDRWGDYLGAQLDWGDYYSGQGAQKIWMVGEYARADGTWGTHVGASTSAAAGVLSVAPATVSTFSGATGGPFTPYSRNYTLQNGGGVGLSWELTGLPAWLNASATGGVLYAGGATNVTIAVNAAANVLPPGVYSATLTFADCFSGGSGSFNRTVRLSVGRVCRGDANCDGQIDFGDINPFIDALINGLYCDGTGATSDVNGNSSVGFDDINPFIDVLTTNPLPIPCP